MPTVLSETVAEFVRLLSPEPDGTLADLEAHNRERGFPIVGPEVGATLRLVARLVDAERVFEFGSGMGYSAYWFAGALPPEGELVLTEVDREELEVAREHLERGGYADRAHFEHGDALETFGRYEGPFDVVLIDHLNAEYVEAFEAARGKLADGGAIVADNVLASGDRSPADLLAGVRGEPTDLDASSRGIVEFLDHVRTDGGFETVALPVGEGITVSVRC